MTPELSVVIPSYNHAPFLLACLDSALGQSFEDVEVILVDDASTDESLDLARSVSDSRLRVIENESNQGAYATLQRAVEASCAPLVAVLNSDDVWSSTKLQKQVELLARYPTASLCFTLGNQIDEYDEVLRTDLHAAWPLLEHQDTLPYLLEENRVLASSVVFRRESFRIATGLRYTGDWVALLFALKDSMACCVPEKLTQWRIHGTNSHVRSPGQLSEEIALRRSILAQPTVWLRHGRDPQLVRLGLSACARHLAALYVLAGSVGDARQQALMAMRLAPDGASMRRFAATMLPGGRARKTLWGEVSQMEPEGSLPVIDFGVDHRKYGDLTS